MCQFRAQGHTQSLSGKTGPCCLCSPAHCFSVNALPPCFISQQQPKATATSQACCPTPGKGQVSWSQGKTQNSYTFLSSAWNKIKNSPVDSIRS